MLETECASVSTGDMRGAIPEAQALATVEAARQVLRLIDALDDHDDVQNVYANYEMSDALMEKLSAA